MFKLAVCSGQTTLFIRGLGCN